MKICIKYSIVRISVLLLAFPLAGNLNGLKGWLSPVLAYQSGNGANDKKGNDIIGLKKPIMVSPNRLTDMSPSDLSRYAGRAINRSGDYKRPSVIVGFSPYMSNWLWSGMYNRPRIFRSLLRKLKSVTDKKKRQQILNDAKRQLESELRTLKNSIKQMEAKADKSIGDSMSLSPDPAKSRQIPLNPGIFVQNKHCCC